MKKVRVGFQGERGAFSQEAVQQLLTDRAEVVPFQRFEEVFRALKKGETDAAVIPIENSLHGSVHENYDHLLHFDFRIVAETNVRIVHNLMAAPGVRFRDIRKVYSHPVALNQCLQFFESHPEIEKTPFYDTAGSVKMAMDQKQLAPESIPPSVPASINAARTRRR